MDEQPPEEAMLGEVDGGSLADLAFLDGTTKQRLREYFNTFCQFCHLAAATNDRYELLDALLSATSEVVKADRYFVLLGDKASTMKVRAARFGDNDSDQGEPSSEFVRQTLEADKPITTYDATSDERFTGRESVMLQDVRSAIGVRLAAGGQTLGVLYLDSQVATGLFGADDAELVHTLGNVASLKLLYLASRQALLDLLTKTRDQVSKYQQLAMDLGGQVLEHAERLDEWLDRQPTDPVAIIEEVRQACAELRDLATPYLPRPAEESD